MPHAVPLITTIAAALGLALILGVVAVRLKLPALVGYLVAGVILGPATPGIVADVDLSRQLAEIGVMLLMFGVGLHFSLSDLLAVKNIALPGALVQIAVATALGMLLSRTWGWSLGAGIVFGLALSVASTVVLLRALEGRGLIESLNGRRRWASPTARRSSSGCVRAGRILRRHGDARVPLESSRRRGVAAVARRLLGPLLRLGRHALRSAPADRPAAARVDGARCHRARQVDRGVSAGDRLSLSGQHGAHRVRQPGTDRRVLVHPRRPRRVPRSPAGRGRGPHPRRRAALDRAQPAGLRRRRAAPGRHPAALPARSSAPTTRWPSCRPRSTRKG